MTSINFKVFGLTRQGFGATGPGLKAATFRFPDHPEHKAGDSHWSQGATHPHMTIDVARRENFNNHATSNHLDNTIQLSQVETAQFHFDTATSSSAYTLLSWQRHSSHDLIFKFHSSVLRWNWVGRTRQERLPAAFVSGLELLSS